MDQLEIVCKHLSQPPAIDYSNNTPWFKNLINKLRDLNKPEKPTHTDDDWEVPFEKIRIFYSDFQRCGSQGDVFYGKLSNTPVAVKRMKNAASTDIKHLRELSHKNILKFRGISQNNKYHYILMEWCPYGTLHDHIHNGRQISSRILSNFAQQIANGMKYLHSKNIIHRDLKPSNILLTHRDTLKISDFGNHKLFDEGFTSITYAGTYAYMAPEVIRGEPYSFPVDVWSYGVVLWEILIGIEPYKNLDSSAVLWAVGNDSFKLPIPFSFPGGFTRVLDGCWKSAASERLTFQQICMILRGATQEVENISQERWLPLQAEWKREVRAELYKHLQFKDDTGENILSRKERLALEMSEEAQRRLSKANNMYLKLQELSMIFQRDREELDREKEQVKQLKEELQRKISQLDSN